VIESNNAKFPLRRSLFHVLNLTFDRCLNTLHPGYIGNVAGLSCHLLIGTVAELHQLSKGVLGFVSLDAVFTFNFLADAHRSGNIDSKDDTNLLLANEFLVLYLSCSLHDIVDLLGLGDLFRLYLNVVLSVAKFASPNLPGGLTVFFFQLVIFAVHIEGCLASLAEYRISSGQF